MVGAGHAAEGQAPRKRATFTGGRIASEPGRGPACVPVASPRCRGEPGLVRRGQPVCVQGPEGRPPWAGRCGWHRPGCWRRVALVSGRRRWWDKARGGWDGPQALPLPHWAYSGTLPQVGDPTENQAWLREAWVAGPHFRGRKPGEKWLGAWRGARRCLGLLVHCRGRAWSGGGRWRLHVHPGGRWTPWTRTRMVGLSGRGRQGPAWLVSRHGLGSTPRPALAVAPTRPPMGHPGAWKRQALPGVTDILQV